MTPRQSQPENRLNDYDQAARFAIRHLDPIGFFRWLMGQKFIDTWKYIHWLDTQAVPFPGGADLRCDTVAGFTHARKTKRPGPPLAFVIEFMSRTRTPTLRRVLRYALQVQEDCPFQLDPRVEFQVLGGIINLTGGEQSDMLIEKPLAAGNLGVRARFKVRTLAQESAEELLADIEARVISRALLVWLPLMVGGDSKDLVGRVRDEILRETNRELRGTIVGLSLVLSELVGRRPLWKETLGEIDMERSQTVLEWEARGEARGEVRATRNNLLAVLRSRYGKNLPAGVSQAIETQSDLAELTAWFNAVLAAKPDETLDALSRRLGWTN